MIRLSTTYKYIIKKIEKKGKKNGMSYIKIDVKDKECRICLLGGKRSEKLRTYCVCNTGYFHEKCLKKWITSRVNIFGLYKHEYYNEKEDFQFKVGLGVKI